MGRSFVITLIAAITMSGPAVAADASNVLNGTLLHQWCEAKNNSCFDYIKGVIEGYMLAQQVAGRDPDIQVCLPSDVNGLQSVLEVQKAMRDHPDLLNLRASAIVMKALLDNYKCKPGQHPVYGAKP